MNKQLVDQQKMGYFDFFLSKGAKLSFQENRQLCTIFKDFIDQD